MLYILHANRRQYRYTDNYSTEFCKSPRIQQSVVAERNSARTADARLTSSHGFNRGRRSITEEFSPFSAERRSTTVSDYNGDSSSPIIENSLAF